MNLGKREAPWILGISWKWILHISQDFVLEHSVLQGFISNEIRFKMTFWLTFNSYTKQLCSLPSFEIKLQAQLLVPTRSIYFKRLDQWKICITFFVASYTMLNQLNNRTMICLTLILVVEFLGEAGHITLAKKIHGDTDRCNTKTKCYVLKHFSHIPATASHFTGLRSSKSLYTTICMAETA